jgi:hypothetical protein
MSEDWIPFFSAVAGAGAALAGLIIVSVASSVDQMVKIRAMTSRAGVAIAVLVVVTLIGLARLIPAQGRHLFAIEALVLGLGGLAFAVDSMVRLLRARSHYRSAIDPWLKGGLAVLPCVALVVGALLDCSRCVARVHLVGRERLGRAGRDPAVDQRYESHAIRLPAGVNTAMQWRVEGVDVDSHPK